MEEYIEKVGCYYERFGLPKMAGRILAYLMSSPKAQVSFDDLVKQLKASKGSISGNVKLLMSQRLIEKFSIAGDRKTYYRFSSRDLFKMLEDKVNSVQEITCLFEEANQFNQAATEKYQTIAEIISFYQFLEVELPKLKEKWLNHQKIKPS
ncbi:MAG: MarR family transcriptional regulator [Bacteroidota bacterium]